MSSKRTEKTWGYEELIYNKQYCCKKLVYTAVKASSLHYHEYKHETFVVASGVFRIESTHFNGTMYAGDSLVLPPKTVHRVKCVTPGTIVECSTRDEPNDCVRLEPSDP